MTDMLTRRSAVELLAIGAFLPCGRAEDRKELYAITASPQPYGDLVFPGVLFSLGAAAREVQWASSLCLPTQGVEYVLYSFEQKVAVLAGPKNAANEIVILSFGSPGGPRTVKVDLQGMFVVGRHFVFIGGRLHLALKLSRDAKYRFLAVRIDDLQVREATAAELYQEFAIDGFVGGLTANNDFAAFRQPAGSRTLVVAEVMPRLPSSVTLPTDQTFPPDENIGLFAANKEILAFTAGQMRLRTGPEATTPYRLLDRRSGTWHSINVPAGGSQARVFGPWLVAQARGLQEEYSPSPGQSARRQQNSATGPAYDSVARGLRLYQPGLIWLYHVPTRRKIVEETGQGDTEVLWVEGDKVLYRCDRILYEARIDGTSLKDKRKLIERDFIADVHWVFYGPPSPPPPDPPWTAFKNYEK
jgi:hypothetical protein